MATIPPLLLLLLFPSLASAHTLYLFVEDIQHGTIHGRAYFPGDVPAQHADVIARDPSGRELGRTATDENGNFSLIVGKRVDHCLVAETADGHSSRPFVVHASALPDSLPSDVPGGGVSQAASLADSRAATPISLAPKENEAVAVREQLTELSAQVELLRRQVSEADERLRVRDVLGGVGFILGLAGVALYMKARRKTA